MICDMSDMRFVPRSMSSSVCSYLELIFLGWVITAIHSKISKGDYGITDKWKVKEVW